MERSAGRSPLPTVRATAASSDPDRYRSAA
jgi:hypothetical protein